MLGIGFTMAAAVPVLMGALRDLTGGFDAALVVLAVLAATAAVLALVALPPTAREQPRW